MRNRYPTLRKKGGVIPFGYKVDGVDPKLLIPIESQLDALCQAYKFLTYCSYEQVAAWLSAKTGRSITRLGLYKKHKALQRSRLHVYYENKKRASAKRRREAVDAEQRRAFTEAKIGNREAQSNQDAGAKAQGS